MSIQNSTDRSILEYALVGLEAEKTRIETAIASVQSQLGKKSPGRPKRDNVPDWVKPKAAATTKTGRRKLSPEARERMAEAQRLRWNKVNAEKAAAEKAAIVKKVAAVATKKTAVKKSVVAKKVAKPVVAVPPAEIAAAASAE